MVAHTICMMFTLSPSIVLSSLIKSPYKTIEFLELQRDEPQEIGFQKLTKKKLEERFGTVKTIKALEKKYRKRKSLLM